MLKKDFLLYLHNDWKLIAAQLHAELNEPGGARHATLEHLRKADQWLAHYATELRKHYQIEA